MMGPCKYGCNYFLYMIVFLYNDPYLIHLTELWEIFKIDKKSSEIGSLKFQECKPLSLEESGAKNPPFCRPHFFFRALGHQEGSSATHLPFRNSRSFGTNAHPLFDRLTSCQLLADKKAQPFALRNNRKVIFMKFVKVYI